MGLGFKAGYAALLGTVSLAGLSGGAAFAQDGFSLEEIVVTARKRAENLQDTPISVAAFTGEALDIRQVTNIAEAGNYVPNLVIDAASPLAGSSGTISAFIRGVGQNDFNLTIDPGVGVYVDGVYVSRSVGGLLDTVDLERMEVLRGPQGTLFGKNTIGGAIVLTSKAPTDEFEASLEAITGRYARRDVRAMLNAPLTDRLAVRATISYQGRDGYYDRLVDGDTMGNRNSLSGRVQVAFEATDQLDLSLTFDGTRSREEGKPLTLLAVNPVSDFAGFSNFAVNGATCFTPPMGLPVPNQPQCFTDQFITDNVFQTNTTDENVSNLDVWGLTFTANWDLGPAQLKSITAYRELSSNFLQDYDGSPLSIGSTANEYSQEQFSQELQLTGTAFDERLNYLVGLFYLGETGTDVNALVFSVADFISGGDVDNDSFAAFAQLTYELTDAFSVTLGGRYTHEDKRFAPNSFIQTDRTGGDLLFLSQLFIPTGNPNGNLILPLEEGTVTAKEFTPAVTLDYKVNEDVLVYAGYSRGFKSGGFTQRIFPPEPFVPGFDPEFVDSFEVGFKSQLFDQRLRLNIAAFYSDYSNLQIIVNEGVAPKVRNAGKAEIKGFEIELEAAPTEWLTINAGTGFTDAQYTEVDPTAAGITADNDLVNVPRWTATAGATAEIWEGAAGILTSRLDWAYRGAHFKDAINTPQLRQPGYSLVNLSARFEAPDSMWAVSAGATNLFDKTYLIAGFNDLEAIGVVTGTFARPREWFLRGEVNF